MKLKDKEPLDFTVKVGFSSKLMKKRIAKPEDAYARLQEDALTLCALCGDPIKTKSYALAINKKLKANRGGIKRVIPRMDTAWIHIDCVQQLADNVKKANDKYKHQFLLDMI